FTMHSAELLRRDVRAGLIGLTLAQARFLLGQVPRGVFVVGDVYAQAHASLVRAPRRVLQTLVSVHHGGGEGPGMRWFMEGFRPPEMWLLRRAQRVYARDQATADWLARARVPATWLGNPMMDGLAASPLLPRDQSRLPVVALLPGSRGQAAASLAVMRRALELASPVVGVVAWAGSGVPRSDQATADWLARARVPATWLGNPMMDGLAASPLLPRDQSRLPVVALLPGSRGQAAASLAVMRRALELASPVVGVVAWAGSGVP